MINRFIFRLWVKRELSLREAGARKRLSKECVEYA